VIPFPARAAGADANADGASCLLGEMLGPELPRPRPLAEAVERAAFGVHEDGEPVDPSEEEVAEITMHHGERLADELESLFTAEMRLATSTDADRMNVIGAVDRARSACQSVLALYEEDFGAEAAHALEAWARHQVEVARDGTYGPGHPWYYLRRGRCRQPVPVDRIPPSLDADSGLPRRMPKDRQKRLALITRTLRHQRQELDCDRQRYAELLERGADALSVYDREVASGGDDELAWATALALKFNQIRNGLGRIAKLEKVLRESTGR
jgi:hypothetical protein